MTGTKGLLSASIALLGGVSALNVQFQDNLQRPLVPQEASQLIESSKDKPLVDSEAIQKLISRDNLLARAEKLYEIAKTSQEEFNHPTRVIGSRDRTNRLPSRRIVPALSWS
jgi:aminopeptidase Y